MYATLITLDWGENWKSKQWIGPRKDLDHCVL